MRVLNVIAVLSSLNLKVVRLISLIVSQVGNKFGGLAVEDDNEE
jgi:hypothetical protein